MRRNLLIATAAIACLASGCGSTQVTAPAAPAPAATPKEAPVPVAAPSAAPVASPAPVVTAPAPALDVPKPEPAAAPAPVTVPAAPVAEAAPVAPAEPPRSVWPAEVASGATVYLGLKDGVDQAAMMRDLQIARGGDAASCLEEGEAEAARASSHG